MINFTSASLTIANNSYGYGHLKRMIILNKLLKKKKIKNEIYCISSKNIKLPNKINKVIYGEKNFLNKIKKKKIVFFDLSNPIFLKSSFFKEISTELKKKKISYVIYDSLEREILRFVKLLKKKYLIICPYLINKKTSNSFKKNYLLGPKYFLFDKIYLNNKNNSKKIKSIFVSCGGLDKNEYTYKIIKKIFSLNLKIKIYATIGPLFSFKNRNKILSLKKNKYLNIYENVSNITKISQNCDLAIVSSGLTKYEMLASKINLAVFCENKYQEKYNMAFVKKKLAYDLSLFVDENDIETKIRKVVLNYSEIFSKFKKKNDIYDLNNFNQLLKKIKKL
jgi:spore coat polysaccharide biosynthesis predicted glycosyltransferase SpsG